jgi:hypothetical protein
MAVKRLSEGYPDGTVLGNSSADKIGFYGKTAITLRSLPISLTAAASTTATYRTAINMIRNLLKNTGLGV